MTRALALLLLLATALLACGGPEAVPSPRALRDEGDRLLGAGRFLEAAERYRLAFSLVDPVPARAKERGYLALRRAAALARADRAVEALDWLDRAQRLDPSDPTAWFERGRLLDGEHAATVDPPRAIEAYRRFLAALARDPEADALAPLATHAKEALERLGAPATDETPGPR